MLFITIVTERWKGNIFERRGDKLEILYLVFVYCTAIDSDYGSSHSDN